MIVTYDPLFRKEAASGSMLYPDGNHPNQVGDNRYQGYPPGSLFTPACRDPGENAACHKNYDEYNECHTSKPSEMISMAPTTIPNTDHRMIPVWEAENARFAASERDASPV